MALYSLEEATQIIKESFPDRKFKISLGISLHIYFLFFIAFLLVSVVCIFLYSGTSIAIKFYALAFIAICFMCAIFVVDHKRFKYLYSLRDKTFVPELIPIDSIMTRRSIRDSEMTQAIYHWPVGSNKVIRAIFSGTTGPLVIPIEGSEKEYALGMVQIKDKKTIPYLMDNNLSRCLLSYTERLHILRAVRKLKKGKPSESVTNENTEILE